MTPDYDVIGSGAGGLTAAMALARKRVLVCEQHEVPGVTYRGLAAARSILGWGMSDLLVQDGPALRIYPSEDISQWPEELQERIERGRERVATG